jgi:hypothetical protein
MVGVAVGAIGVIVTFATACPVELSGVTLLVSVTIEDSVFELVLLDCTTLLTALVLVITVVISCWAITAVLVETSTLVTTFVPVTSCVEVITATSAVLLGAVPSVIPADCAACWVSVKAPLSDAEAVGVVSLVLPPALLVATSVGVGGTGVAVASEPPPHAPNISVAVISADTITAEVFG